MSIRKSIPNLLTSANLLLGTVGVYFAILGRPDLTTCAIIIAAIFDFFDGFAARALKAYSNIGKDLDSLADLISFGFAPSAIFSSFIHFKITGSWNNTFFELTTIQQIAVVFPFILTAFAALRLAKFNNDTRQTENFIGLTTTATGMFTASMGYILFNDKYNIADKTEIWMIIALVIIFSALLVSEIPMFSLKFKSLKWKENIHRFILLIFSIIALIWLNIGALVVIIPAYVLYSIILMIRDKHFS